MSEVRIQVVLARAGVAARRKAEAYIKEGRVSVNGKVVTELGTKIDPAKDKVTVDGVPLDEAQPRATIVLYKPDKVVTTVSDPEGRATVLTMLEEEPFRFVPVGRLDFHTEGVLLLSTDGELVNRLLHPRYHVPKVYRVKVAGLPSPGDLDALRSGIHLEDGPTKPAVVEIIDSDEKSAWMEMVVTEGRNRLVRRMCDAIHHTAFRVVRTEFATIGLGDLRPGQYRYLTGQELNALYKTAGLPAPSQPERAEEVGGRTLGASQRHRGAMPGERGDRPRARPSGGRPGPKKSFGPRDGDRPRRDGDRPRRDGDRPPPRRFDRDGDRGERPAPRRFDRDGDRGERPAPRRFDRDGDRGERPAPRRFDRDGDRGERPAPRRFDRDGDRGERPAPRRFDRDGDRGERPAPRRFDRAAGDRPPPRKFDRGADRPAPRRFDRAAADGEARGDRPAPRRFDRDADRGGDRPAPRRFDRAGGDRPPPRRFDRAGGDRPPVRRPDERPPRDAPRRMDEEAGERPGRLERERPRDEDDDRPAPKKFVGDKDREIAVRAAQKERPRDGTAKPRRFERDRARSERRAATGERPRRTEGAAGGEGDAKARPRAEGRSRSAPRGARPGPRGGRSGPRRR